MQKVDEGTIVGIEERLERYHKLMPESIKSLKKITGEDCRREHERKDKCFCYTAVADWDEWWKKNEKTFEPTPVE